MRGDGAPVLKVGVVSDRNREYSVISQGSSLDSMIYDHVRAHEALVPNLLDRSNARSPRWLIVVYRVQLSPSALQGRTADSAFSKGPADPYCSVPIRYAPSVLEESV